MSNNMFGPTFVTNLVTLACKMWPGMPKEASSLSGSQCTYSMKQNLHNRTHLKLRQWMSLPSLRMIREKLQTWVLTKLSALLPAGMLRRQQYPCWVKTISTHWLLNLSFCSHSGGNITIDCEVHNGIWQSLSRHVESDIQLAGYRFYQWDKKLPPKLYS